MKKLNKNNFQKVFLNVLRYFQFKIEIEMEFSRMLADICHQGMLTEG